MANTLKTRHEIAAPSDQKALDRYEKAKAKKKAKK